MGAWRGHRGHRHPPEQPGQLEGEGVLLAGGGGGGGEKGGGGGSGRGGEEEGGGEGRGEGGGRGGGGREGERKREREHENSQIVQVTQGPTQTNTVCLYWPLTKVPVRLAKGLIPGAVGMGGNGGGTIPGSPNPTRSGRPGGRSPARGGVGNPGMEWNQSIHVVYSRSRARALS